MKTVVVGMQAPAITAHHNYTTPPEPGNFADILKTLFQDIGNLERAAVPDSGAPVSSAKLRERK